MVQKSHRGVRTTVEIPEDLWRKTKQRALDTDTDFRSVLIEALENLLGSKSRKGGKRDAER